MNIRIASIKSVALTAALACAAPLAGEAAAADLEVRIDGLRSAEGSARVALYQHVPDADFPDDEGLVARALHPAAPGTMRVVFVDLAPGDYAVAAFHDADGDGDLGTNLLGMPSEGFGFSNGALGFFGPPSFEAAAVTVGAGDSVHTVSVPIAYPLAYTQEPGR